MKSFEPQTFDETVLAHDHCRQPDRATGRATFCDKLFDFATLWGEFFGVIWGAKKGNLKTPKSPPKWIAAEHGTPRRRMG
jgi:hypothetical protein